MKRETQFEMKSKDTCGEGRGQWGAGRAQYPHTTLEAVRHQWIQLIPCQR